ncbi:MAG: hypothetical protein J7605_05285 [Variovorax sp.]|nr:hypothetical protein [Variovorax sp.]
MTPPLVWLVAGLLLGGIGMGLFGIVCARIFTREVRKELIDRLRDHEQSMRQALMERDSATLLAPGFDEPRFAQHVQRVIQVEIEYLAQCQRDCDARHAEDMRALLHALEVREGKAVASATTPRSEVPERKSGQVSPSRPAVSAHPPELMHVPLPRVKPCHEPEEPKLELSDEEIDALPPDLPQPAKQRRRILAAPVKPPLRSI